MVYTRSLASANPVESLDQRPQWLYLRLNALEQLLYGAYVSSLNDWAERLLYGGQS